MSTKNNNQNTKTNDHSKDNKPKVNPPSVLAIRTKTDISFINFPTQLDEAETILKDGPRIPITQIVDPQGDLIWTTRGDRCAVPTAHGIFVYNVDITKPEFSLQLHAHIPYKTSRWLQFSPRGTYLLSFETQTRDCNENLSIWDLSQFGSQKAISETDQYGLLCRRPQIDDISIMPHSILQWTDDEKYAFFLTSRGVLNCYNSTDLSTSLTTYEQRGLVTFALSQIVDKVTQGSSTVPEQASENQHISLFSPTVGDKPGIIALFRVTDILTAKTTKQLSPRQTLSLFRATEVHMKWHSSGKAMLALTYFDDPTVDSYYPESRLFLMYTDAPPKRVGFNDTNPNPNVFDVQWNTAGYEFGTLHGKSHDAQLTIWYAKDCSIVSELASGPWNKIYYSPGGRLILVAGVGSLSGHYEIWDKQTSTCLHRSQDKESPRLFGWSACGQYIYNATLFPWLRVDNQFKILSYLGKIIYSEKGKIPAITKHVNAGNEMNAITLKQKGPDQGHFCQVSAHVYPRVGLMSDLKITNAVVKAARERLEADKRNNTRPVRASLTDFADGSGISFQKKKVDTTGFGSWRR